MKEKKIIFIDVDGTLCLDDQSIPKSAIESIQKARKKGHLVYLCTGRSKAELFEPIMDIGFDGVIGAGGGYCEVNGEVIFHKKVTSDQVRHAVDYFTQHKIAFYIESNDGLYASENCLDVLISLLAKDQEMTKELREEALKHPFVEALIIGESLYRDDINKICFLGNTEIPFEDIKQEFEHEYEVIHCTVPAFRSNSGELAVAGVHKANAIEALLNYLNLSQKNTIAIGDGLNDIEMLEYCQIGIALQNGHPKLQAIANYVSKAHHQDGIMHAFEKYNLI